MKRKQVLVFAAHGDDETNGCAGALFQLKLIKWDIHIVYATSPEGRALECEKAATLLGATFELWGGTDGQLYDDEANRAKSAEVFKRIKPDLVLVMCGHDVHPDHRAMNSLALGPALQRGVNTEIMLYELCSSGRHTDGDRPQTLGFHPTHLVILNATMFEDDPVRQAFPSIGAEGFCVEGSIAEMTRCHASQDPEAMIKGMGRVHLNRGREFGNVLDMNVAGEIGPAMCEAFVRITRVGPLKHNLELVFRPTRLAAERGIGCDFDPKDIGIEV